MRMILFVLMFLVWISSVEAQKKDSFGEKQTFAGVATPVITSTLKCGFNDTYRGIITYVARPGQVLHGPIYGNEGKIVFPGDIIIQMKTNYRVKIVTEKKANVKSAKAKIIYASEQYQRYKRMVKTHSVSVADFQNYEYQYLSAVANKEAAEAELELAKVILDACTVRAQFAAVVDKVLFPAGYCAGELEIVTISQLFPMGIKIKMDRQTASKITNATPISVYPVSTGKATGVFHGFSCFTDDGIMLKVNNYLLPPPVKLDTPQGRIPVVECAIVIHADSKNSPTLSVPIKSIQKDSKGYYVWKGEGQQNMRPGIGLDHVFPVKKVYIVPENLSQHIASYSFFRILKDPKSLKPYDTVLIQIPPNLKDGDKVCFYRNRFLFMPGDPVKVVIGK